MARWLVFVAGVACAIVSCVAGPPEFALPAPSGGASDDARAPEGVRLLLGSSGPPDGAAVGQGAGVGTRDPLALPREASEAASRGTRPSDASGVADVALGAAGGGLSSAGEGGPGASEADAGVMPAPRYASCVSVRACARDGTETVPQCLAAASPLARAQADRVLACQLDACRLSCLPGQLFSVCNACLLRSCSRDFVACARESGCGNGRLDPEEECDDGDLDDDDVCTGACTRARCGDGLVLAAVEACDDGNLIDTDGCLGTCQSAYCGDGVVRVGVEGCDDGNRADGDGCSASCRLETCGNGVRDAAEECDEGPDNGNDRPCLLTCRINRCGDGWPCEDELRGCGARLGTLLEACDDANDRDDDGCVSTCQVARCGDGLLQSGVEVCDDGNPSSFDICTNECAAAADHLLISEIVTRPNGAEMIEIVNPTRFEVDLSNYAVSDSHLYAKIASGGFSTASGSDFAARFPPGSLIGPGEYRSIALANASGGSVSFLAVYRTRPDFELRPVANGAINDAAVVDMLPAAPGSIGASASLTDGGEPVILFDVAHGPLVLDVDYVFYGIATASNPPVDKTGEPGYRADTPAMLQHMTAAPGEAGSLHRCDFSEGAEVRGGGNGTTAHDETSEDASRSFVVTAQAALRTPRAAPPPGVCPN